MGMIQIDMPMPKNCRMCPVCSEYDICLIPVDGKGFGEQNVSEFTESRPEWCPMKEQEEVEPEKTCSSSGITWWNVCGNCKTAINPNDKYCHECGRAVKWE